MYTPAIRSSPGASGDDGAGRGRMSGRKEVVIMEYGVIKEDGLDKLTKKVNDAIGKGWRLQGGVCAYFDATVFGGFHAHWAQAMIRENK